jgi:hypothetical protein
MKISSPVLVTGPTSSNEETKLEVKGAKRLEKEGERENKKEKKNAHCLSQGQERKLFNVLLFRNSLLSMSSFCRAR